MPISRKQQLEKKIQAGLNLPEEQAQKSAKALVILDYGGRYQCPACSSVHHYDSQDGCHNPRCDYRDRLICLRKGTDEFAR